MFGRGVAKDEAAALTFLLTGCDGAATWGCVLAGSLHAQGTGTAKDEARARQLYERGCASKDALSCMQVGRMYVGGDGMPVDFEKAVPPLEVACSAKLEDSCTLLGLSLLVVGKDGARAKQLLERECARDDADACKVLGDGYRADRPGWPADPAMERQLLEKACRLGLRPACDEVGHLPPRSLP